MALAFWFIYSKLMSSDNLEQFLTIIHTKPKAEMWFVLGSVFVIMLVNWLIEAVKWKRLISSVERISLWLAVESVFCGLTWAVFTPNRLGEYGGRVFFLSPKRRVVGVVAMAVGQIAQLVIVCVLGAISTCIFIYKFVPLDIRLFAAICGATTLFCLFFLVFYFNIKWLNRILLSIKFTRKYGKFYAILARYQTRELATLILFSLVRYTISSLQYLIMFLWLIPGVNFFEVLVIVSVQFLVQTTLPSLGLIDIGVRSVTAVTLFKYITSQSTAIVACTASIWLINIIIPAILGAYFVFKLNFFGNHQHT